MAVVTGLQERFDWRGVAASAAGAGVGAAVGLALDGAKFGFNDFGNQLVRGTLTGLAAGTTAAVMRGGRISVQQIATDAFGNALGSSLAGGSFSGSQNEDRLGDFIAQQETAQTQRDQYRPYTGGADWATDVAMRRASYPTYAQSAPQPYGNDEFRSSERAYRSATESSTPGTSVRAGAGASISSILGTSEPQAIGNFMRANNLTTDRLQAGGTYFVPASANSYGDQQALGQGALNAGNARIAARQEAAAQAASMDQANQQRWDAMQVGAWSGRTGQGGASSMGVGAIAQGRTSMSDYWSQVSDAGVNEGSFVKYMGGRAMQSLGNVGHSAASMATAASSNPGAAYDGALKSFVNLGTDTFNAATNAVKTSLNGYSMVLEKLGAGEGAFAGLRDSSAFNITPLARYSNEAEAGGGMLAQLATGAALTKYGNYNIGLNTGEAGAVYANALPVRLAAPNGISEGISDLRPLSSPNYSVIGDFQLKPGTLTASDANHFRQGNRQVYERMQTDPALAAQLEAQNPGITAHVTPGPRGGVADTAPPGLTWHHDAYVSGNLQLMPRIQHQSPGPVQNTLHPNQQGGRQLWGGGRN